MATISLSGGEELERKLSELSAKLSRGGTLRVGFLEDATYPDGTPVAMIAAIQNFGAPAKGIPPRPFFSNFIEKNAPGWGGQLAGLLQANDYDVEKSLNQMGLGMVGQLQESLIATNAPPLSDVTLLLRERFANHADITFADVQQAWQDLADGVRPTISGTGAKPLVWTGHMSNSIDFEVVDNG